MTERWRMEANQSSSTPTCKLYLVGGSVRDLMMGEEPKDKDFAVEAPSYEAMKEFLAPRLVKVWQERPEFLTLRAQAVTNLHWEPGMTAMLGPADFTLCRAEADYTDGRHPDKVEPATILTDLSRRDFTINAMAMDEAGVVLDPYHGLDDMNARLLRCVGDPVMRFREDSLRILRALRFAVTLGFYLTDDTDETVRRMAWLLHELPVERVHAELSRMFKADWYGSMLLLSEYPEVCDVLKRMPKLWLKPTLEDK